MNPRLLKDAVRDLRQGRERGIGVFRGEGGRGYKYGAAIAANLALIDPEMAAEFRIEDEWAFAKDLFDKNSSLKTIDPLELDIYFWGDIREKMRSILEWGVYLKLVFPDRAGEVTGGADLWEQTRELLEKLRTHDKGVFHTPSWEATHGFARVLRDAKILASPSVQVTSKGLELS